MAKIVEVKLRSYDSDKKVNCFTVTYESGRTRRYGYAYLADHEGLPPAKVIAFIGNSVCVSCETTVHGVTTLIYKDIPDNEHEPIESVSEQSENVPEPDSTDEPERVMELDGNEYTETLSSLKKARHEYLTHTSSVRVKQFTVCQFEKNPRTGEYIKNLSDIIKALRNYTIFTEWACCIHDKDVYTDDSIDDMRYTLIQEVKKHGVTDEMSISEYISENSWAKAGDLKGKHLHIVVRCANAMTIWQISNLLGVPEHLIKKVKGRGAFLDCIEYLTHENQQELGKHRYDDSEVITSDNFSDWRERLDSFGET